MNTRKSRWSNSRGMLAAAALGALAAIASSAGAQPLLLTFEDGVAMSNSPGTVVPVWSRLSDLYLESHGVRFFSGAPFVAVVLHGDRSPSGVNVLGATTPDGRLTYLHVFPVEAAFFDPTGTIKYVVSTVSVRGDLQYVWGTKTLEAYDVQGNLLGSDTQLDSNPAPLAVSAAGIHHIRMFSQSATVGFDDLRFDTPRPVTSCLGDLNGDTFVDDSDFQIFAAAYNTLDCADPAMPAGCPSDFNADGFVDDADFLGFVIAYNAVLCP